MGVAVGYGPRGACIQLQEDCAKRKLIVKMSFWVWRDLCLKAGSQVPPEKTKFEPESLTVNSYRENGLRFAHRFLIHAGVKSR